MAKHDRMRVGTTEDVIRDVRNEYDPATAKLLENFISGDIPKQRMRRVPEIVGNKRVTTSSSPNEKDQRASRGLVWTASLAQGHRWRRGDSLTAGEADSVIPDEVLHLRPRQGNALGRRPRRRSSGRLRPSRSLPRQD